MSEDLKEFVGLPLLGDKFPSIKVNTTHGVINLPDDYKGKWFVLFSHPGDFTPVCTTEFVGFSKKAEEFKKLNCELIGLSVDQVFSHIKWVEWIEENLDIKVPFPIIADELGILAKKLGMIHESKGTNTVRAVFIVDPKGAMRLMMYYPQEIGRSVDEVLRSVKALIVSTTQGVACPENFPHNELLGENCVMIPPLSSVQAIADMKKNPDPKITVKDWWFRYKKL
jgi:peroxiredoxin (alkyl hydroperoxide reductase subunit C)